MGDKWMSYHSRAEEIFEKVMKTKSASGVTLDLSELLSTAKTEGILPGFNLGLADVVSRFEPVTRPLLVSLAQWKECHGRLFTNHCFANILLGKSIEEGKADMDPE